MSSPRAAPKARPKAAKKVTASKIARKTGRKAASKVATKARPPAPPAASITPGPGVDADLSARARQVGREIEQALADGRIDALAQEALQALMAALCKCYSMQVEAGCVDLPVAGRDATTGTDIMTVASGLLKAGNLAVFELGMWQAWTGR